MFCPNCREETEAISLIKYDSRAKMVIKAYRCKKCREISHETYQNIKIEIMSF